MSIHAALEEIPVDKSYEYIQDYFSEDRPFSGAHFNSFRHEPGTDNKITLADIYSVNLLALDVPGSAGLKILDQDAEQISELLSEIPDTPLGDLSDAEFEKHLGRDSAAMTLWRLLIKYKGMGVARVSKLMARKRPHLIPIRDSIVARVAKFRNKDNDWELWWKALEGNKELENRAENLRQAVKQPNLSTLRVFDILLWYSGREGIHSKE